MYQLALGFSFSAVAYCLVSHQLKNLLISTTVAFFPAKHLSNCVLRSTKSQLAVHPNLFPYSFSFYSLWPLYCIMIWSGVQSNWDVDFRAENLSVSSTIWCISKLLMADKAKEAWSFDEFNWSLEIWCFPPATGWQQGPVNAHWRSYIGRPRCRRREYWRSAKYSVESWPRPPTLAKFWYFWTVKLQLSLWKYNGGCALRLLATEKRYREGALKIKSSPHSERLGLSFLDLLLNRSAPQCSLSPQ